jgi:hypothetical protein
MAIGGEGVSALVRRLFCLPLAFIGCSYSAGPVTKVTLAAGEVRKLVARDLAPPPVDDPFPVTDRGVIERCVRELNALSCEPYRPGADADVLWSIVLTGENEKLLAEFAFSEPEFIMVCLPDRERFFVKHEKLPNVKALYRYRKFSRAREGLLELAGKDSWTQEEREAAKFRVETINGIYPRASLPVPSSPADLAKSLKPLAGVSLDNLGEFVDR